MNTDTLVEWFRRQEIRVIKVAGTYWAELASGVYQSLPYQKLLCPNKEEIKEMLRSQHAFGVRYSTPVESAEGMISYHVVCSDKDYSLDKLKAKARYDVRKGLSHFLIEPISLARLASEGWKLRQETLIRQDRSHAESKPWWDKLCHSAEGLPGVECWGALDKKTGDLISSLLVFICDDFFCILYQQSRTEQMRLGSNNVLTYVVTENALKRPGISEVFYGLHSLDAPASVDAYKFRMGFKAKPVRQQVVFHPWVAPLFGWGSQSVLKSLLKMSPGHPMLAKMEGMVRFSIEGRRSLADQQWPEILIQQRLCIEGIKERDEPGVAFKRSKDGAICGKNSTDASANGNGSFYINPLGKEDLPAVTTIHLRAFPDFFLSVLGGKFLQNFYRSFICDSCGVALVAREAGTNRILGAVVGPIAPNNFFRQLLIRRWWAFCVASTSAVLRNPRVAIRLWRALFYRGDQPVGRSRALLSSIAVVPEARCRGIGRMLVDAWVSEIRSRGLSGCYLTTDADNNEATNRFYAGAGWTIDTTFITPEGRRMNRYVLDWDMGNNCQFQIRGNQKIIKDHKAELSHA